MLILLIANFLIRSGRLERFFLIVKTSYARKSGRFTKAALFLLLMLFSVPGTYSNNSSLMAVYHHVSEALPVPKGINHMLFYLQRDPDANTVVYQLNIHNGELNSRQPVNAFWVKYADKGQVKELSAIQRRLAYGIISKALANGNHELRFVSYPKLPLYLIKEVEGNTYSVLANVQHKEMVLNRIFVRVKEGAFYFPKVEYIELTGKDAQTGEAFTHRINI